MTKSRKDNAVSNDTPMGEAREVLDRGVIQILRDCIDAGDPEILTRVPEGRYFDVPARLDRLEDPRQAHAHPAEMIV